MATGRRDNSRGFYEDGLEELMARPPEPGEYYAELLKHEFLADEAKSLLRAVLPSGDMLSSREEVLSPTAVEVQTVVKVQNEIIEEKYKAIREATRKAEMALGAAKINLFVFEQQFTINYPRLKCTLNVKYAPDKDKCVYHIQVAHKEQHIYLIDEEEDADVFPSEYLLARMGLVG